MDRHRLMIRTVSLIAGPLCVIAMAAPATASTDAARRGILSGFTAFLWSSSTMPTSLDSYYLYTSLANSVTISNPGTGRYEVVFNGLASVPAQPTVQVTTYDALTNCDVVLMQATSTTMTVDVDCWSFAGVPQNARFDLLVGQALASPPGVVDYALVERNGHHLFSFNSSHKRNTVTHLGTGRYEVTMGGKATKGVTGTVKVTDVGIGANCTIAGWHGSPAGERVFVDCFKARGAVADQMFFVAYARRGNLTGWMGATTADAFANRPTAASYRPSVQDNNTRGAHVQVSRQSTGQYTVTFAGSAGPNGVTGGHVQVTAVSTRDHHCFVVDWSSGTNPRAQIDCVDNHGNAVDSRFTVQWINDAPPV